MFRPFTLVFSSLAAIAIAVWTASETCADDLFSTVPIDSVFSSSPEAAAGEPANRPAEPPERRVKVLNVGQLADLLRDAGLEPETTGEDLTEIKFQHARWTLPVVLGLADDREEIRLVMLLSELKNQQQLPADRLFGLLAANRTHQPACFSYSEKRSRIEVSLSIDNEQISPRVLREEIRRLATIAEATANLWETVASAPSTATPSGATTGNSSARPTVTVAIPQRKAAAAAPAGLAGKWSAARSAKEAFALLLNGDGSFVLVHVKDGKQDRSTGSYVLNGGTLTLSAKGGTNLVGSVSNVTAKSFDFAPQGGAAAKLTFQKAS